MHAEALVAPTLVAYLPLLHAVHELLPWVGWYWPAMHNEHATDPSTAVNMPAAQYAQLLELTAPVTVEYRPAKHRVQEDCPTADR